MQQNTTPLVAIIREDECIGCVKCIQACPFDAILGTAREMHTVITDECIGCKLCVSPCPVDCIEIVPLDVTLSKEARVERAKIAKQNFHARENRLKTLEKPTTAQPATLTDKKAYIQAALLRAQVKFIR